MFVSKRQRRFPRRGAAEAFSFKGAVVLALKQMLFFIVVGCVVWLAHTLIYPRSDAMANSRGSDNKHAAATQNSDSSADHEHGPDDAAERR